MDVYRLTQGEKLAGISAILLFVFMFFDWYGFSASVSLGAFGGSFSAGGNAWDTLDIIPWLLVIAIIGTLAIVVAEASDANVDMPVHRATIITVLGGIAFLLILFRIVDTPTLSTAGISFSGSVTLQVGIFLSLIAAAGMAFGGWRAMQEEGASFGDAADRLSSGGGNDPSAGPPPPPPAQTPPPPPPPPSSTPPPPPPPPPSSGP